jgi:hypothetical protein
MLAHGFTDGILGRLVARDSRAGDHVRRQPADRGDPADDHRRRAAGGRRYVAAPGGWPAQPLFPSSSDSRAKFTAIRRALVALKARRPRE